MSAKIMAIINTSPESFAGDGSLDETIIARRLKKAIAEGADILDIGGQSTRPGAEIISEEAEIERVVPAIKIARQLTDMPISIDTFKPAVAEAALQAGATILNDIHGGEDERMVALARHYGCEIVVMHSRGTPETMSKLTNYSDGVVNEVISFLTQRAQALIAHGIAPEKIIIDPGIGFAKTAAQSFELTRELARLKQLGYPVLYGASRKSFLGKALADDAGEQLPAGERLPATTVTTIVALQQGADIIRVHDVAPAVHARRILDCIMHPEIAE